jgi:hypothetical protein
MEMRTVHRPRRYIARHWLLLLTPVIRYSSSRDAYVLRGVGRRMGPALRPDRRHSQPFDGVERRRTSAA